ncbi:hypothetical protein CEN41_01260 [Fischerella thermalis CCMEE 5330]|uniref:Glycosyltransferase RgtA/B/C/D-like domain-containing protein n=1 Tax=Fischerella thermalis CCMEE 5330 TaxID=2019670 RepID=A0A2N6MNT4_9CYAN|nr:hypothetical protein CEN41_01260 [Fischerella thermalis CCMEE 5330]
MRRVENAARAAFWLVVVGWLVSAAFKLSLSDTIIFDYDIVPVVALGWEWLHAGGAFPVHGTLASVAAYNLPGLVWLHLPALMVTSSPWLAMLLTLLWVNMLGTFAAYALGRELSHPLGGAAAALLFTFSEGAIAATTIAWAQLLLPTFFVGVALCLFRWQRTGHGGWMLAAGLIALLAFMTHFSAVLLLPVMIVFWLLSGAVVRWRWLLLTAALAGGLLAPYLAFQAQRDFRDLQAFLTRRVQIPHEAFEAVRAEARRLANAQAAPVAAAPAPFTPAPAPSPEPENRVLRFVQRLPRELALAVESQTQFIVRAPLDSPTNGLEQALTWALRLALLGVSAAALWGVGRRVVRRVPRRAGRGWAGQMTLLLALPLTLVAGMLVLRVYPTENASYLAGLQGWFAVLTGAALGVMMTRWRWLRVPVLALVIGACVVSVVHHQQRLEARQEALFPRAWYYRTLHALADHIAASIAPARTVTVGYALWPQTRTFDWVPAWGLVDRGYRAGMSLDFVLLAEHGIQNLNTDPYGVADAPDFIMVFTPDLGDRRAVIEVNGAALLDTR